MRPTRVVRDLRVPCGFLGHRSCRMPASPGLGHASGPLDVRTEAGSSASASGRRRPRRRDARPDSDALCEPAIPVTVRITAGRIGGSRPPSLRLTPCVSRKLKPRRRSGAGPATGRCRAGPVPGTGRSEFRASRSAPVIGQVCPRSRCFRNARGAFRESRFHLAPRRSRKAVFERSAWGGPIDGRAVGVGAGPALPPAARGPAGGF